MGGLGAALYAEYARVVPVLLFEYVRVRRCMWCASPGGFSTSSLEARQPSFHKFGLYESKTRQSFSDRFAILCPHEKLKEKGTANVSSTAVQATHGQKGQHGRFQCRVSAIGVGCTASFDAAGAGGAMQFAEREGILVSPICPPAPRTTLEARVK